MSIESSSATSSPKMLGTVENGVAKGKGKLKSEEEVQDPARGGFPALMTALDLGTDASTDASIPVIDPPAGLALPMATPESPDVATGPSAMPVDVSGAGWSNELALLLAQAGAGGVGLVESVADAANGSLDSTGLQAQGLVSAVQVAASTPVAVPNLGIAAAPTSPVLDVGPPKAAAFGPMAADVLIAGSQGQGPAMKASVHATSLVATVKGKVDVSAATAALLGSAPGDVSLAVGGVMEQAAQSLSALSIKAMGAGFQSGLGATVGDTRALQQAGRLDLATSEAVASGAVLSSEISDTLLKPAQRLANKFAGLPAGAGIEASWGHQALLAGGRVNASVALASASTQTLESMVADTVSYWVTQGVQNAELTLDGFGGEPVEVRISLKGDQAHIGFRTDQPEIRQMLEGALAHLKEVLKSEGLVLSGVSVGTSGQNGAGAQEQRDRAGSRQTGQTSLITADAGPMTGRQRINPAVGRALDLFV